MSKKQKTQHDKMLAEGWVLAGTIGVDAGLCWIGDPCYCVTPDGDSHPAPDWSSFCGELAKREKDGVAQWNYKLGHEGLGVSVSTGLGDGVYPVYVKYKECCGRRVAEARVVFISDEEEES